MERSRSVLDEVLECEDEGAILAIPAVCGVFVTSLREQSKYFINGMALIKWEHPMTTSEIVDAIRDGGMTACMTNKPCTCDKEK